MTTHFLDTSALVKRYHTELGADKIKTLFADPDNTFFISQIALVEIASAFQRRKTRGEMNPESLTHALERFDADVLNSLAVVEINRELIDQARSLVLSNNLRALDALQLASALGTKSESLVFISADERLVQAAQANGLSVLNPVSSS